MCLPFSWVSFCEASTCLSGRSFPVVLNTLFSCACMQTEGVYNQRLQNLAITLDKVVITYWHSSFWIAVSLFFRSTLVI